MIAHTKIPPRALGRGLARWGFVLSVFLLLTTGCATTGGNPAFWQGFAQGMSRQQQPQETGFERYSQPPARNQSSSCQVIDMGGGYSQVSCQ